MLVVVLALTGLTASALAEEKSGKVEIKNDFIVVHPGTKLSKADVQALNKVLKQYDKSLYKIKIYKNGKVTRTVGTLNDMYIDQRAVADLAQATTSGQSERAIQVIAPPAKMAPVNPQTASPSPAGPQAPSSPMPAGPQAPSSPAPAGPQMPSSPAPAGPQAPSSPVPSGPQMPTSPAPSGPHMPGSPAPSGPQRPSSPKPAGPHIPPGSPVNPQTSGSATNPQKSTTTNQQQAEFLEKLKPILEKYSK